jgi:hypothetical protein
METPMSVLLKDNLEHLLRCHWAEFLDSPKIISDLRRYVLDTSFVEVRQESLPPKRVLLNLSDLKLRENDHEFDLTFEFTVPKKQGVVIGTVIYQMGWNGNLNLVKFYGTHLLPKITERLTT